MEIVEVPGVNKKRSGISEGDQESHKDLVCLEFPGEK